MQQTYNKEERLKKKKLISQLFNEGKSITIFPVKLVYLETEHEGHYKVQAGVSVAKRNFKKAVDRNKIKRLLREAYRKIERGTITYPIDTYLRLPLFLFEAGHRDEAWMEYNRLLIDGIHGDSPNVVPMNRSRVYDKMRLMLQKEGKTEYAVQ